MMMILLPILEYFEDNLTCRQYGRAGRRRDPRYDVGTWNVHQRVDKDNLPRINNFVEGAPTTIQISRSS